MLILEYNLINTHFGQFILVKMVILMPLDRGLNLGYYELKLEKNLILDLGGEWCTYGGSCTPIGGAFA